MSIDDDDDDVAADDDDDDVAGVDDDEYDDVDGLDVFGEVVLEVLVSKLDVDYEQLLLVR